MKDKELRDQVSNMGRTHRNLLDTFQSQLTRLEKVIAALLEHLELKAEGYPAGIAISSTVAKSIRKEQLSIERAQDRTEGALMAKKRFSVWEKGSFFYEAILEDTKSPSQTYSLNAVDKIPGDVVKAFVEECIDREKINRHGARFLCEFAKLWAESGAPRRKK